MLKRASRGPNLGGSADGVFAFDPGQQVPQPQGGFGQFLQTGLLRQGTHGKHHQGLHQAHVPEVEAGLRGDAIGQPLLHSRKRRNIRDIFPVDPGPACLFDAMPPLDQVSLGLQAKVLLGHAQGQIR